MLLLLNPHVALKVVNVKCRTAAVAEIAAEVAALRSAAHVDRQVAADAAG